MLCIPLAHLTIAQNESHGFNLLEVLLYAQGEEMESENIVAFCLFVCFLFFFF